MFLLGNESYTHTKTSMCRIYRQFYSECFWLYIGIMQMSWHSEWGENLGCICKNGALLHKEEKQTIYWGIQEQDGLSVTTGKPKKLRSGRLQNMRLHSCDTWKVTLQRGSAWGKFVVMNCLGWNCATGNILRDKEKVNAKRSPVVLGRSCGFVWVGWN